MGSTELAANLFRATQADEKIKKENIKGKDKANKAHFAVGHEVRNTIRRIGGTMPENLQTPKISAKQLESIKKKEQSKLLPGKVRKPNTKS